VAVPTDGTATLAATDHRVEHARLATREVTDLPRGIIAYKYANATPALTTTPTEICRLSNVPVVTGRLYVFSMYWRALTTTNGGSTSLNIKTPQTPSAVTGTTDLVIDALTLIQGNASYGHFQWQQMFRAPTGLITIVLQAAVGVTTGNIWLGDVDSNANLSVRDIGPNRGGQ
jgi:hypothetical protein